MMDDFYTYPYPQHPAYSPPPDYTSGASGDWSAATPANPMLPTGRMPLGAQLFGDTAYAFLQSFVAWFQAVRRA